MTLEIKNPDLINIINNNEKFFSFLKKCVSNSEVVCGAYFERAENELKEKILDKYKVIVLFEHDSTNNILDIKIKINNEVELLFLYKKNDLEDPIAVELKYQKNKKIFGITSSVEDEKIFIDAYYTKIHLFKELNTLTINYYTKYIAYNKLNNDIEEDYIALNKYFKSNFEKGIENLKGNINISQEDIDLFKLVEDVQLPSKFPDNYKRLDYLKDIIIKERKKNALKIW